MKNKIYLQLTFIVAALNSGSILAGPFGLEMGMTLDQIDKNARLIAPGKYTTEIVPKPHSSFEYYTLQIGPKSGLCWIKAVGKDITTNIYGSELQSAFEEMRKRLGNNYGSSKLIDILYPNSIWNEPEDWMPGLIKKERVLFAKWDNVSGASLKDNLNMIIMGAKATNRENGYLSVDYHFKNQEVCNKEITDQEDGSL